MPTPSTRSTALTAIKVKLQAITVAGGYFTDAGLKVIYGNAGHTKDDGLPRVVMSTAKVSPETFTQQAQQFKLPIVVEGERTATDPVSPLDSAEELLADIKRALFAANTTLDGKVIDLHLVDEEVFDREDGALTVGARVTLVADYAEDFTA